MIFDLERFKITRPGLIPVRLWNDMIDVLSSALITSFVGGAVVRTIHGTNLYARGGGGGDAAILPFACTLVPQKNPDGTPAGNKVRVELNSKLYASISPWSYAGVSITGLYDPDPTSSGYPMEFDLEGPDDTTDYTSPGGVPDDYVVLEFDGVNPTAAVIDTKGNGSTVDPSLASWDSSGNALLACDTATPPNQTKARIVLAAYIDGGLRQIVTSNLVLVDCVVSGQLAQYPYRFP